MSKVSMVFNAWINISTALEISGKSLLRAYYLHYLTFTSFFILIFFVKYLLVLNISHLINKKVLFFLGVYLREHHLCNMRSKAIGLYYVNMLLNSDYNRIGENVLSNYGRNIHMLLLSN